MTLTIDLAPDEEARLLNAARREGLDKVEFARRLLTQNLPPLPGDEQNESCDADARERARIAAIDAVVGKYAHPGIAVEQLHHEHRLDEDRSDGLLDDWKP